MPNSYRRQNRKPTSARAIILLVATAFVFMSTPNLRAADDILIADFEGTNYGNWKVTGDAFGPGPVRGRFPGQGQVAGFKGKRLVNSYFNSDPTTGTLTSPGFKIERKFIGFLIGGGKFKATTCMNLLIDSKVVRNSTGPDEPVGKGGRAKNDSLEVHELKSSWSQR